MIHWCVDAPFAVVCNYRTLFIESLNIKRSTMNNEQ